MLRRERCTTPQKHYLIKKVNLGTQFSLLLQYDALGKHAAEENQVGTPGTRVRVTGFLWCQSNYEIDLFLKICVQYCRTNKRKFGVSLTNWDQFLGGDTEPLAVLLPTGTSWSANADHPSPHLGKEK